MLNKSAALQIAVKFAAYRASQTSKEAQELYSAFTSGDHHPGRTALAQALSAEMALACNTAQPHSPTR